MASTVIGTLANVPTFEGAGPAVDLVVLLHNAAVFLVASIRARHHLLNLSAVTARFDKNLAASAQPFMAALLTLMLPTGHHITTLLATAPTAIVPYEDMAGMVQHGTSDHKDAGNSVVLAAFRMFVHTSVVVVQEWPLGRHPLHTSTYTTPAYHPWVDCTQDISIALPAAALPPAVAGGSAA
ncbi:hypothetical protein VE02_04847 [Pseudogymnoascus sp. 03VT05]|nr:hypothetical protein VE02_04847 [Pseudogymnoascus sp. 03VT05]